ncbi:hypothetical protein BD779DRAFT_1804618 [Infundibulicybe gibba]|nr:hypothetical protein BD779DRAFT_1804618 [Infundibulicybe gibba]
MATLSHRAWIEYAPPSPIYDTTGMTTPRLWMIDDLRWVRPNLPHHQPSLPLAFHYDSNEEKRLRSAVFLIELLNIDLYNYTRRIPAVSNFQGTVYRGVSFTTEQLAEFQHLCERPVSERYWAIPLAMMSASTSRDVALHDFAGAGTGPNAQFPFYGVSTLSTSSHHISKLQVPIPHQHRLEHLRCPD